MLLHALSENCSTPCLACLSAARAWRHSEANELPSSSGAPFGLSPGLLIGTVRMRSITLAGVCLLLCIESPGQLVDSPPRRQARGVLCVRGVHSHAGDESPPRLRTLHAPHQIYL